MRTKLQNLWEPRSNPDIFWGRSSLGFSIWVFLLMPGVLLVTDSDLFLLTCGTISTPDRQISENISSLVVVSVSEAAWKCRNGYPRQVYLKPSPTHDRDTRTPWRALHCSVSTKTRRSFNFPWMHGMRMAFTSVTSFVN